MAGVRPAQQFVGLQGGAVLAARVPRAGPSQQFVRFEGQAVLLLGGHGAGPGQQLVRLEGRRRLLRPGVAGQGAAEAPVLRLGGARVLGLDGAGTSPPQQLMRFGDAVLLRFQLGFAFTATGGRITWRPSKWNNN